MKHKKLLIIPLVIVVAIGAFGTFFVYSLFKAGNELAIPNYEVGDHRGAKFCGSCHNEIYNEWSQNSAHAISKTNERFIEFRDKLTENYVLNATFGVEMCHSCQGPLEYGVDCETCHGVIPPNMEIMKAHELKFKPARASNMSKPDFCPKCHELGEAMTSYADWQLSEAAAEGITCQGCHMPIENGVPYHGFDSISRSHDVEMYRDDLVIKNIKYDFPEISLEVENRVTGHAIPTAGPSRLLVLEISFKDSNGVEQHKIVESFAKYMSLMPFVGLLPFEVINNTQLQSGEARQLGYILPPGLEGQIKKAEVTLRFYDVSDDHKGNLEMAHWVSEPIIEEEIKF